MINRVYLKELIFFDEIELELKKGLIVLSGSSGAGKSLLMNAILSTFGYKTAEAKVCEIAIDRPMRLKSEAYALEDEIIVKSLKRGKVRYYLDGQNISKKSLNELFRPFVQYLSVHDRNAFQSEQLIGFIDNGLIHSNKSFRQLLKEYKKRYVNYKVKVGALKKIKKDALKLAELIEFTTFEIEKIESINPKIGEDDELLKIKHQLSRIDKINDALRQANEIFGLEESVHEVYRLLEKDETSFVEMITQLRSDFEEIEILCEELSEVDIESVLDRLEKISYLKTRYGTVEEALEYCTIKRKELAGYHNIDQEQSMLESFLAMEFSELSVIAGRIAVARRTEAIRFEQRLEPYLKELRLPALEFVFNTIALEGLGQDHLTINLNGSIATTLSGGEFNRVRLALMVVSLGVVQDGGVLILDEIDANVSGDESIAIANMIAKLSSAYQIFAISHQAHLASKANQHIRISKSDDISRVTLLDKQGRVDEIARIIGGENPNAEALSFALKLLD